MLTPEITGETTNGTAYTAEAPGGKLKIVRPFTVETGGSTVLTLDFDGEKSLISTGNGNFMFKPVVQLAIDYQGKAEQEQEQEREHSQGQEQEQEHGAG